jgi:RNA polymerase sigma-70 factor, ECF subfamily
MKRFLLGVLLVATLCVPARAGDLTISGEDQAWSGSGTSPAFTVGIENNGVTGTDFLAGWSLGLSISPESGAVGSLSFATASLPSDYLLDGNSEVESGLGFLPSNPSLPASSILPIGDVTNSGGVTVPSSGDNLLALSFVTGPGTTSGVFDILAVTNPQLTLSYWTENNSSFTSVAFGNFTTGTEPVLLGTVTIGVAAAPEPNSAVIVLDGLLGFVAYSYSAAAWPRRLRLFEHQYRSVLVCGRSAALWLNGVEKIGRGCRREPPPRKFRRREQTMADPASARSADDLLIDRAVAGDTAALAELFGRYRKRLRAMVRLRMDRRLQGRVDPSDVLQEAFVDVAQQLPSYLTKPEMPFYLWLRLTTGQRLMRLHRQHLGAASREAGREVSLHRGALPQASSVSLAAQLLGKLTSASKAVERVEIQLQLQAALNGMDEIDREIIALRNFEELSNAEAAQVLGLEPPAASKRYVRALKRLKEVLKGIPGLL